MATIKIDDLYAETITADTEFQLEGGTLYVGEWGAGVELQFKGADAFISYDDQSPGAVFRAPSTGKMKWVHTSDSPVSLKQIEQH